MIPKDIEQILCSGDTMDAGQAAVLARLEAEAVGREAWAPSPAKAQEMADEWNGKSVRERTEAGAHILALLHKHEDRKGNMPDDIKDKVQKIQETKEAEAKKANGVVATDEHAVHAVHTPWKAPTTLSSGAVGAGIGLVFGGPLGAAVGFGVGAAVEHYRIAGGPVGWLAKKLGIFQTKAPPETPVGTPAAGGATK